MTMGVARALTKRGFARGDRIALLSANRAEYLAAYYGIMRAGLVAVPVNYRFPKKTIEFIVKDAGARLAVLRPHQPRELPGRPARRLLRRGGPRGLRPLPRSRGVRDRGSETARAGDVSLYLGLHRHTQGRGALARQPHLGGGDPARARPRPPSLSDRGAALPHECAGARKARQRRARHHRAAAAVRSARLCRGDRTFPADLAHGRAADDRHDAARNRNACAHRFVERRIHPHGLGAGERELDASHPPRLPEGRGDQRLWHDRGGAGGVRTPSQGIAAAGELGRLSACQGAAAPVRRQKPQRTTRRSGNEVSGADERLSQSS